MLPRFSLRRQGVEGATLVRVPGPVIEDARVSHDVLELLSRPSYVVAPELLFWQLSHSTPDGDVTIELTEVEAYAGTDDPASHAARGRTPRTEIMFGSAGRLYVYFSYGVHWCANVVTGQDGTASAVLLRAGRVVDGTELARERRGTRTSNRALARGPACLTRALGIGREQNHADLVDGSGPRLTAPEQGRADPPVSSGPRVGVSKAADVPWRFWVTDEPTVSAYTRSPRAER